MEKASISENELLAFVSENPNSNAVKSTFKNRSQSYIKEFYKDTKMFGRICKRIWTWIKRVLMTLVD